MFYERRVPQNSSNIDDKQPLIDQLARKDLCSVIHMSMHPLIRLLNEAGR